MDGGFLEEKNWELGIGLHIKHCRLFRAWRNYILHVQRNIVKHGTLSQGVRFSKIHSILGCLRDRLSLMEPNME